MTNDKYAFHNGWDDARRRMPLVLTVTGMKTSPCPAYTAGWRIASVGLMNGGLTALPAKDGPKR